MRRATLASLTLLALLPASPAQAADLARYRDPAVRQAVVALTREAIRAHFAGRAFRPPATGALKAPAGVFVTLSGRGFTRGCWGSVHPAAGSAAVEIADNAVKALFRDYRQAPISRRELEGLVAHVSIIGPLVPVSSEAGLQPRRFGLLVAAPGKGGVLLPGEAATAAWQVYTCRKKAGLRPGDRASMYRFETAVIGPIALSGLE